MRIEFYNREASKVLIVLFIIFILIVNAWLICAQVLRKQFYNSSRYMVIMSIAIADIIFAFFPLILQAKFIYELDLSIIFNCSLHAACMTYELYFRSFVYGVGLLVMAIEMMVRHKDFSCAVPFFKTPCRRSLAVSAVPWIVSSVFVFPLFYASFDFEHCEYLRPNAVMNVFCVYVPSILALMASVLVICTKRTSYNMNDDISTAGCAINTNSDDVIPFNEVISLLLISVANAALMFPYIAVHGENSTSTKPNTYLALYHLTVARSFLTPLILTCFTDISLMRKGISELRLKIWPKM